MYINVKEGIIREIVSASGNYQSKEYETIPVPDTFAGIVGDKVLYFDSKWELRNLSELVAEKIVILNEDEKLDGEILRKKTAEELIDDGLIKLNADEKLVEGRIEKKSEIEQMRDGNIPIPKGYKIIKEKESLALVPMNLDELVAAGEITKEKVYEMKLASVLQERMLAYQNEADTLFFGYQRGENTREEWIEKISEIKARLPKPFL